MFIHSSVRIVNPSCHSDLRKIDYRFLSETIHHCEKKNYFDWYQIKSKIKTQSYSFILKIYKHIYIYTWVLIYFFDIDFFIYFWHRYVPILNICTLFKACIYIFIYLKSVSKESSLSEIWMKVFVIYHEYIYIYIYMHAKYLILINKNIKNICESVFICKENKNILLYLQLKAKYSFFSIKISFYLISFLVFLFISLLISLFFSFNLFLFPFLF